MAYSNQIASNLGDLINSMAELYPKVYLRHHYEAGEFIKDMLEAGIIVDFDWDVEQVLQEMFINEQ